ncbi:hypothetical protein N0M98_05510 [Paenibacillus doosanensis]|nr:hypothetical protein [Paenibacillus doosanensis]MCS7459592.1 hypothetical protein [Paenibacillus doosanensis]
MFEVGDRVVFVLDGAKGVIVEAEAEVGFYHIIWEDRFTSWEKEEMLEKPKE